MHRITRSLYRCKRRGSGQAGAVTTLHTRVDGSGGLTRDGQGVIFVDSWTLLARRFVNAEIVKTKTVAEGFELLKAGKVNALAVDRVLAQIYRSGCPPTSVSRRSP